MNRLYYHALLRLLLWTLTRLGFGFIDLYTPGGGDVRAIHAAVDEEAFQASLSDLATETEAPA